MKFTLTFDMDSAAFEHDALAAAADVLHAVAHKLMESRINWFAQPFANEPLNVRDVNGNTIGHWEISK